MTKRLAVLLFMLTACTTTTSPVPAPDPLSPPTESVVVKMTTVPDSDGVIPRFTNDIWPAMEGYRYPAQGSPENRRYIAIVDKDLPVEEWGALRDANQDLGVVWQNKRKRETFDFPQGDLHLEDVSLTSLHPPVATLVICFAFDALRSEMTGYVKESAASEATIELRKIDTWYLHAITDDHRVPACGAPKD